MALQQIAEKCAIAYANGENPLPELREKYRTVFQHYFTGIENSGVEHSALLENVNTLFVALAIFNPTEESPSSVADVYVFLNGETAFASHKVENAFEEWVK